jgi:hypothetical protein
MRDPWLAPIRGRSDVCALLRETHEHVIDATAMFRKAHGPEMLECVTAPRSL